MTELRLDLKRAVEHRNDYMVVLVEVPAGFRARSEAPFGDACEVVVVLDSGNGSWSDHGLPVHTCTEDGVIVTPARQSPTATRVARPGVSRIHTHAVATAVFLNAAMKQMAAFATISRSSLYGVPTAQQIGGDGGRRRLGRTEPPSESGPVTMATRPVRREERKEP